MEGHLKIVSLKEVELAGARPWKVTSGNYAEYPLIILSRDGKKEIGRVTADRDGNYRVVLPPSDYILDVQRHESGNLRAKPQPFTIVAGQTVRVAMTIATGSSGGDRPAGIGDLPAINRQIRIKLSTSI